jgi:cobalt-zinc-cadmium efflux system membrane fusion protein
VVLAESPVAVAVRNSSLQTLGTELSVFVRTVGGFEPRAVSTGRSDGEWTEVLAGLAAAEEYVSAGSFILKAELGKAEAEHEH